MTVVLLSFALTAWVSWFLVRPHLLPAEAVETVTGNAVLDGLVEQRERSLQVLKDLELDYSMGKLVEGDYRQMKRSLYRDLASLLERIDRARSR